MGEFSTPRLSFQQDLQAYRAAGVDGIGIDAGLKLHGEPGNLQAFKESDLQATFCFPSTPSILPLTQIPGTSNPLERVEEICAGIQDLSPYEPLAVMCVTGPQGGYEARRARDLAVRGLRDIAQTAAAHGLTVMVEPMHKTLRKDWSLIADIPETIALLDEVNASNLAMMFDVWHLSDTPDVLRHIRDHVHRFAGVQINDRPSVPRSWCDRLLPGDGVADLPGILIALAEGGYDGWYELEIFSDDGSFGDDFPDSLWKLDPVSMVRSGRRKFEAIWQASRAR